MEKVDIVHYLEKVDIIEQHRKSRHTSAAWKRWTKHSSVETVHIVEQRGKKTDIAQQRGKSRHSGAVRKE